MRFSRRQMLAAGAAVPLASFVNRYSQAQPGGKRLKFIVLNTDLSFHYHLYPELTGSTAGADYKYPEFLAPVLAETKQVRIVTGLFNQERLDLHGGFGTSLTCMPIMDCGCCTCIAPLGGISIDQAIANGLDAASPTKFKSLVLTTPFRLEWNQYMKSFSATGPGQNVQPESSPERAYAKVFGATGVATTPKVSDTDRRLSILDLVGTDASRIQKLAPAGARPQIDQFMASVESQQKRLQTLGMGPKTVSCMPLTAPALKLPNPAFTYDFDGTDKMSSKAAMWTDYPAYNEAQLDLMAMALACDHTHVAYFDIGSRIYPDISINQDHHDFTHSNKYFKADEITRFGDVGGPKNVEGDDGVRAIDKRNADLVAYLVKKLASFVNADGTTLLDDTIIYWNVHSGHNSHDGNHEVPVVMIGGKNIGPAFTFVRFGDTGGRKISDWGSVGAPLPGSRFLGDFYTTLASWYGVQMDGFGNPAKRKGMVPL